MTLVSSLDEAPISSRHVLVTLLRNTDIPERELSAAPIVTQVDRENRAVTTVKLPQTSRYDVQQQWLNQAWDALRRLPGAAPGIPFAGVSQTYEVTWDGVCRPI